MCECTVLPGEQTGSGTKLSVGFSWFVFFYFVYVLAYVCECVYVCVTVIRQKVIALPADSRFLPKSNNRETRAAVSQISASLIAQHSKEVRSLKRKHFDDIEALKVQTKNAKKKSVQRLNSQQAKHDARTEAAYEKTERCRAAVIAFCSDASLAPQSP
jgi:hypothetical protein